MADSFFSTDALVLREVKYKEADRILTLYSSKYGKITAKAAGALRKNSKIGAATQLLTYADFELYSVKGRMMVKEAAVREDFGALRQDFADYALGCYLAECVEMHSEENNPDREVLQLILNSLYALSRKMANPLLIKAAFETRLISIMGYRPDLGACTVCGRREPEEPILGVESGHIFCRECHRSDSDRICYLDLDSLKSMRYIIDSPAKSFIPKDLSGESLKMLSECAEEYFVNHSGRYPGTLEYWKKL